MQWDAPMPAAMEDAVEEIAAREPMDVVSEGGGPMDWEEPATEAMVVDQPSPRGDPMDWESVWDGFPETIEPTDYGFPKPMDWQSSAEYWNTDHTVTEPRAWWRDTWN